MYSKFPVRVDFTALSSMYPRGSNPRGSVLGRKDPEVQACHSCGSGHFIHFIGQGKQILELAIFVAARLAVSIDVEGLSIVNDSRLEIICLCLRH